MEMWILLHQATSSLENFMSLYSMVSGTLYCTNCSSIKKFMAIIFELCYNSQNQHTDKIQNPKDFNRICISCTGLSERSEDLCRLYCKPRRSQAYYSLKDKVIDGTKCGKSGLDICVNGMCRPGGCDNILDSKKSFGKFFNFSPLYFSSVFYKTVLNAF